MKEIITWLVWPQCKDSLKEYGRYLVQTKNDPYIWSCIFRLNELWFCETRNLNKDRIVAVAELPKGVPL